MTSGRLIPPNLDDRTWRDIVEQARALIPRYTPEWTDHNPSDLGITLIELFAWIAESMIYRLNQVPEKNYVEFLNLLGITRDPATPASTYVTYRLVTDSEPVIIPKGHQVATPQSETDQAIVFETDQPLRALSTNLTTALLVQGNQLQNNQYVNISTDLVAAPLSGKALSIAPEESAWILLGFDTKTADELRLKARFAQPLAAENSVQITWHYSANALAPNGWPPDRANSDPPILTADQTEGLQKNGEITLVLPERWTAQNPEDWAALTPQTPADQIKDPLFWIGLKLFNESEVSSVAIALDHLLFNSVSATQALTISQPELLGISSGLPFQSFELAHQPLYKRPLARDPYDHLIIQVRQRRDDGSFDDWQDWSHRDDFPKGAGPYFQLEPVTGTVRFGNYHPTISPDGHGSIPPAGSEIRAGKETLEGGVSQFISYRYVAGGAQGNVAPGSIQVVRSLLNNVAGVTNPGAGTGGSDQEPIEETKRRAPDVLRNRYRAITVEDYEYLAREASTDIKKVRCLPPRRFTEYDGFNDRVGQPWNYGGLNRSPESLNVMIVPELNQAETLPAAVLVEREPRPMPSQELRQEVKAYLDERRPLTTHLNVVSPRYLPIKVEADVQLWPRVVDERLVDPDQFQQDLEGKIRLFLHPLLGGISGQGWEIGQDITVASLFEVIQPDSEVGFISRLQIRTVLPPDNPERPNQDEGNRLSAWIRMADYEMVCAAEPDVGVTVLT